MPDASDDDTSNCPLGTLMNSDVSQFDDTDLVYQKLLDQQRKTLEEVRKRR